METTTITIEVDAEAAEVFANASPEERKKMELLLSMHFKRIASKPERTLKQVMDDMGSQAAASGLTPEILVSICAAGKLSIRFVLDTNFIVSAVLFPHSVPRLAFDLTLQQGSLLASEDTLRELADVLLRTRFDRHVDFDTRGGVSA